VERAAAIAAATLSSASPVELQIKNLPRTGGSQARRASGRGRPAKNRSPPRLGTLPCPTSLFPHALLGSCRLFKIAHLNDSPTQIVMIDLADSRKIWNLRSTGVFPVRAPCLPVKVAHAFVGVHNEHFLHNRSRGRGDHSCRILGSAPLNSAF
jgi:hypothetical protein